ncbi:AAA domain-containing protein [Candidatus Falkowbacteria bacterium]|nr:AAA domain-containing protein [Candidatus Falkowbacteria bacterium]
MDEKRNGQQVADEVKRVLDALGTISKREKDESGEAVGKRADSDFIANFTMRPAELISQLEKKVIGQEQALRILATKICGHYNAVRSRLAKGSNPMDDVDRIKSNILLVGPTGSGKSFLLKLIAKIVGVPFVKVDATKFTEAGYVGGDVEDIIRDLARKTKLKDGQTDVALAQFGIVFIDEVDKIASSNGSIGPDVSRRGVQQALLTLIEDAEVSLKEKPDVEQIVRAYKLASEGKEIPPQTISTKNILFVFAGAFPGLEEIVGKRLTQKQLGFGAEIRRKSDNKDLLRKTTNEDLKSFGMEPELLGRVPVRVMLDELTEEQLFTILRNPEAPIIMHFSEVMESYGVDVDFEDGVLRHIAKLAVSEGTGARGLLAAFEATIGVYETHLSETPVTKLTFTLPMIDGTIEPLEFINALNDGYAERQEEALRLVAADKEHQASIDGYVDYVKTKHALSLQFDADARNKISILALDAKQTDCDVCVRIFGECEAAFTLLANKGRTHLIVTVAAVDSPMNFLENAFKE